MTAWHALARRSRTPGDECAVHRVALLDLLDGGLQDRASDQALEHLARCATCQQEIGEYALVVAGLRRLGAAARRAETPGGGWARLLARLQAPRPARGMRLARIRFAGLVAVPVVLVATLVAAGGVAYQSAGPASAGTAPAATTAVGAAAAAPAALHQAALQRAFAISDQAYADEAGSADAPSVVTPRGPLPDGMTLFAASDQVDGARSSGLPIATAIVAE